MTKPNCEAIAVDNLQRQGFGCYCPRFKLTRPDKTTLLKPLFPRYIFCQIADLWYVIRGTRGVSYLLMGDDGPAQVSEAVIKSIKAKEDPDGFISLGKQPHQEKFAQGTKVRATDGPFTSFDMIYAGMSAHDRVKVLIELLGRKVVATVEEKSLVAA